MVIERDSGEMRGRAGALLADLSGGPGAEIGVDGGVFGPTAGQPEEGEGRGPAQGAPQPEAEFAGLAQRHGGGRAEEAALCEPGPVRSAAVQGVGSVIGAIRGFGGPGAAAEGVVGLVDGHQGTGLGGRDRCGEPGEAAADDVDALHVPVPSVEERVMEGTAGSADV